MKKNASFIAKRWSELNAHQPLIGVKSWVACEKKLATVIFADMVPCDVIDATADRFSVYPEHMAFSLLTVKKRWTKMGIIALDNGLKGPSPGLSDHITR